MDCDFIGNDIIGRCIKDLSDSECIDQCIKNLDCTHWAYNTMWNRSCCLKKANRDTKESIQVEAKCGFVPSRLNQDWAMNAFTERKIPSGAPNVWVGLGGSKVLLLLFHLAWGTR